MKNEDDKVHESADRTVVTSIEKVEPSDQKRAYILFLAGPLVGKLHLLEEGKTIIGRSPDVTIPVNDNRVSRRHLCISVQGDVATIEDLGSTNGTFVNGKRVTTHVLADGDKIQVSSATIFKFALQDQTENIFHKELYKMAVVDPVTGVYNKRYFQERIKEELSLARRSKGGLALIMIDIDHFKNVNDTHGHLAGDMILHQVAALLRGDIRQEDLLARYGGEEFAVIVRGGTEEQTVQLAERMRKTVESAPITFEEKNIPVTISLGVAALEEGHDYTDPNALIQAADECLYHSKQHGRNKTTSTSAMGKT